MRPSRKARSGIGASPRIRASFHRSRTPCSVCATNPRGGRKRNNPSWVASVPASAACRRGVSTALEWGAVSAAAVRRLRRPGSAGSRPARRESSKRAQPSGVGENPPAVSAARASCQSGHNPPRPYFGLSSLYSLRQDSITTLACGRLVNQCSFRLLMTRPSAVRSKTKSIDQT